MKGTDEFRGEKIMCTQRHFHGNVTGNYNGHKPCYVRRADESKNHARLLAFRCKGGYQVKTGPTMPRIGTVRTLKELSEFV